MIGQKKRRRESAKKSKPSFLVKLYAILSDEKTIKEYSQYIHWSNEGLSVVISDKNGFTNKVLPKFFNHENFDSFIRQLNMYNFYKVKGDKKEGICYRHNEFNKFKSKEEILNIKKKTKKPAIKPKNILDKKLGVNIKNEDNHIIDQIYLMEEDAKLKEYEQILQKGEVSANFNESMLKYLLDKSKEDIDDKKWEENAIDNVIKQRKQLKEEYKKYKEEYDSEYKSCIKMQQKIAQLLGVIVEKVKNENIDSNKKFRTLALKYAYKNKLKIKINDSIILHDCDLDLKSNQSSRIFYNDNTINNNMRNNLNNPLFNNTTISKF